MTTPSRPPTDSEERVRELEGAVRACVLWLWLSAECEAECMPLWGDEEIGHA